ncbi:MAG TPA: type II toxin-antitoxin system HicA family toxin [Candidatus Nanoarchaeia archaeon]|nr:type II toxin-antitoxin system HicA family toxin [Candidatus Nanoarchaeia archaeon]
MAKLPQLSAAELAKILKKLGFEIIRQEGSHMFFRHSDGRTTVVPNHPGEKIGRGLLVKIIKKDVKISRGEFERCF